MGQLVQPVPKLVCDCTFGYCNTFTFTKIRKQRKLISVDRMDPAKVLVIFPNTSGISHIVKFSNMFDFVTISKTEIFMVLI